MTDSFRLATVTSLSAGKPQIRFDGEASATTKQYPWLASYTPTSNDRVLLAKVSGIWVILGKINT